MVAETLSKTQLPIGASTATVDDELLAHGIAVGREWAQSALERGRKWAVENPGQFVLAGVAAGFILGKLLFSRRRAE